MDRKAELIDKVTNLVVTGFAGDYKAAFAQYDANTDGLISRDELDKLLVDADVGNRFTRPAWITGVLDAMDADKDGFISWDEFDKVFKESKDTE